MQIVKLYLKFGEFKRSVIKGITFVITKLKIQL